MSAEITEPTAETSCPTCGAPLPSAGALAEICSDVLDDNLTIPVLAGAAAWLMAMYVG